MCQSGAAQGAILHQTRPTYWAAAASAGSAALGRTDCVQVPLDHVGNGRPPVFTGRRRPLRQLRQIPMSIVERTPAASGLDRWLPAFGTMHAPLEIVETPLSWIVLTERHAYKVKKAVDSGDAHFGSLELRRQACTDEIWLNRRLAPGVYLGVVPITRDADGGVALNGKGSAIEWAVKMRRLSAHRSMHALIVDGALSDDQVELLANVLANFYFTSPPATISLEELRARLQRRIDLATRDDVLQPPRLRRALEDLRSLQTDYLHRTQFVLNLRACDGRILDGHGDLRPEHVFFERAPPSSTAWNTAPNDDSATPWTTWPPSPWNVIGSTATTSRRPS